MLYPVFHYATLDNALNELLNNNRAARVQTTTPAINVKENQSGYELELAVPGMTKEDFHVDVNPDNELVISMEKKNEEKEEDPKKKGTYLRREFSYSRFQQSLLLPDNVETEKISAKVEHGVMTIDIPKKKVEEKAPASRRIEIK